MASSRSTPCNTRHILVDYHGGLPTVCSESAWRENWPKQGNLLCCLCSRRLRRGLLSKPYFTGLLHSYDHSTNSDTIRLRRHKAWQHAQRTYPCRASAQAGGNVSQKTTAEHYRYRLTRPFDKGVYSWYHLGRPRMCWDICSGVRTIRAPPAHIGIRLVTHLSANTFARCMPGPTLPQAR